MSPKISILMPVFNEVKHIEESVRSVMNQTESNFELIIIDDGSTDGTIEAITKLIIDPRITVLSPGKVGKNEAFNLGYRVSKGEWVVFLAGDDILPKDSLENRLFGTRKYDPNNDLIGGYGQLITFSKNRAFTDVKMPKTGNKGYPCGGTLILSKALAEEVFPIPVGLPNEDLWTSMYIKYFSESIIDIPYIVINYRIHENNSVSRTMSFEKQWETIRERHKAYEMFLEKNRDKLDGMFVKELESLVLAEKNSVDGRLFALVCQKDLSVFNKLKFLSYNNKYLYRLRMLFFRLFSGWARS